jgi:hypothetical protein
MALDDVSKDVADNFERADKALTHMSGEAKSLHQSLGAVSGFGAGMGMGGPGSFNTGVPGQIVNAGSNLPSQQSSLTTGATIPGMMDPASAGYKAASSGLGRMMGVKAAQLAIGAFGLLPTADESLNIESFSNRLRFYGYQQNGKVITSVNQAYADQRSVSRMGTPTNAMDVTNAYNMGAGMGLLPGLNNFQGKSGFSGVMGGAALVSNLLPGAGISGGVQAMAGLNNARNVNMLRMIGINVRNGAGSQMNDLPDIIGQLYNLLKQSSGGVVTPQSIAISAMSGNALDSILNQYFGNDAQLRQSVLVGLTQMANTGGKNLATSGSSASMQATGGTTPSIRSLATRNTAELGMLQAWTKATNAGFMTANQGISGLFNAFDSLGNAKGVSKDQSMVARLLGLPEDLLSTAMKGGQGLLTGLETFSGIRGGAGFGLVSAMTSRIHNPKTGLGLLKTMKSHSDWSRLGLVGTGVGAAAFGAIALGKLAENQDPNADVAGMTSNYPAVTPGVPSGTTYTGDVYVNVTAPPDTDPWAFGNAVAKAMAARS